MMLTRGVHPSWLPPWVPFNPEFIPSWRALDVEDNQLADGRVAEQAVAVLEELQHTQFFSRCWL